LGDVTAGKMRYSNNFPTVAVLSSRPHRCPPSDAAPASPIARVVAMTTSRVTTAGSRVVVVLGNADAILKLIKDDVDEPTVE
jgi:hypothetical protein